MPFVVGLATVAAVLAIVAAFAARAVVATVEAAHGELAGAPAQSS